MSRIKILIAIVLAAFAYASAVRAEGRFFKSVSNANGGGMTGMTVYDIKQTDDGFTWFATDQGLVRFDGEHVVSVEMPEEDGTQAVKAIAPMRGGRLLAGTPRKVYVVEPADRGHRVTSLLDKPFSSSSGVAVGDRLSIIGGEEGIVVYNPSTKEMARMNISSDILEYSNKVIDMSVDGRNVYILTNSGIYRLDTSSRKVTPVCKEPLDGLAAPTAIAAVGGSLYVGSAGQGVWKVNLKTSRTEPVFPVISGSVVTSIKLSHDKKYLYIGTDGGGVTRIDTATGYADRVIRHNNSDPASPASNQVYSLLTDSNGLLWIGYYQNGADYSPASSGPFEMMDNPDWNTRGISVRALSIDNDLILIGTREGILAKSERNRMPWRIGSPHMRSEMVISLLTSGGKTYVGTYGGGLEVIDLSTHTISPFRGAPGDPTFTNGHIFAIAADREGNLWVGTNNGLYEFRGTELLNHFKSYNSPLPQGNVYGIFFDSEGKGWVSTETGLCVYDPRRKTLRTDLFPASFPHSTRVRSVYEDSSRRLWFVPETGEVFSCGLDFSDLHYLRDPMIDGSDVKGVVEDARTNIWIATNRGVFRRDSLGHFHRFGLSSGLPSTTFLQAQPVSDGEGGIWFGNSSGLVRLDEKSVDKSIKLQRRLVPTSVEVNGRPYTTVVRPDDGIYRIGFGRYPNSVTIDFSTLSYTLDEPDSYEYSLDGAKWERFHRELSLTFYELRPGSHELIVRPVNDCEGESLTTKIVLKIPFPGIWMAIGALIVVVLVLGGLYLWRHIRQKRALREEEQIPEPESVEESKENTEAESSDAPRRKYAANPLSRTEARQISQKVKDVMESDRPYLNPDLKIGDLAALVGVSSHKLSQFFNQVMGKTFYDYINSWRVEEFKRLVASDESKAYTLTAMAEKSGFSSRASFFRYFKNAEGISPGEYMKGRNKGSKD